jgi:hypothetical protein
MYTNSQIKKLLLRLGDCSVWACMTWDFMTWVFTDLGMHSMSVHRVLEWLDFVRKNAFSSVIQNQYFPCQSTVRISAIFYYTQINGSWVKSEKQAWGVIHKHVFSKNLEIFIICYSWTSLVFTNNKQDSLFSGLKWGFCTCVAEITCVLLF